MASQTVSNAFINSIVGEGSKFRGELDIQGFLRIDGDFSGSIRTNGNVLIGAKGRVESSIKANTVVVGGVVKGNIYSSEKVMVLSTGMVLGNITAPRLLVEEGVLIQGTCIVKGESGAAKQRNSEKNRSDDQKKDSQKKRELFKWKK